MTPTLLLQTDAFIKSIIGWDYRGETGTSTTTGLIDSILTQSIGTGWRESYSDMITLMNETAALCPTGTGGEGYSLSEYNRSTRELLRSLTERELFSPIKGRPLAPYAHTYLDALFGLGWETDLRPLRALLFRTAEYLQLLQSTRDPESGRGFPPWMRWDRGEKNLPVSSEQVEAFLDTFVGEDCVIMHSPQRLSPGLYELIGERLGVDWEHRTGELGELLWSTAEDLHRIALGDPAEAIQDREWALRFYDVISGEEGREKTEGADDYFGVGASPHLYTHLSGALGVGWNVPARNFTGEMRNQDRVRMRLQALAGYLLKVAAVIAESGVPETVNHGFIEMPTADREQALAFFEVLTCSVNGNTGISGRRSPHAYINLSSFLGTEWEFTPLQVRTFLNPVDIKNPEHAGLRRMLGRLSAYLRAVAEQLDPDLPRPDQVWLKERGLIFPSESNPGRFLLTFNQAAAFYQSLSGVEHLNEQQTRRMSPHAYSSLSAVLGSDWELDTVELGLLKENSTSNTPLPPYLDHVALHGKMRRFVHYLRSVSWRLDPEIQGRFEAQEIPVGVRSTQKQGSI
ncbi:hypothetical protein ACFL3H_07865 [Gemmatimonadota bacterium]